MKLNATQIAEYQAQGALVVKNVIPREHIDRAVAAFEAVVTGFADECDIPREDYATVISQIRDLWKYDSLYHELIFNSPLPEMAATLMGRSGARLLHDHVITKPKGTSDEVPWHQDYPFWPVDCRDGLSCWLAMDDLDENAGTLEIIPGSHLLGEEAPVDFIQNPRREFSQRTDRVRLPVEKGDVVILHCLTWHRTGPNTSVPFRRAYISLWIPPESRYAPLHADWHPVNFNITVQKGEFLNEDWFPVIGEVDRREMEKTVPVPLQFHGPEAAADELSMFNASRIAKIRIHELMQDCGILPPEGKLGAYNWLMGTSRRRDFVSKLAERGAITDAPGADKCLHELSINSIAWEKHKARNVYNHSYVDFNRIFDLEISRPQKSR